MMSGFGFNVHSAWEKLGVNPHDPNAMLKVMLKQQEDITNLTVQLHDTAKNLLETTENLSKLVAVATELVTTVQELESKHDTLAERVRSMSHRVA